MGINLFVDDLGRLQLDDVKGFLGDDGPVESRLREGARVEFKGSGPTDEIDSSSICKAVAAFSNAWGGLVFVGLAGQKPEGSWKEIKGIKRGGSELGTRLNAIIRTGVQPAPRVSIGVVQLPGDGGPRDLAVIRVEEGDWPPYVYWATKNEQKIVVRSNDESLPPKLLELDALYERRARTSKASERRMPLGLPGLKSPFGRLVIETGRPTAVLFHRGTDDTLQDAAFRFLRGDKGLEVFQRTAHSFGFHTTGSLGEVRALWMHASGCVMFATRTTPEGFDGPGTISITDLADDLIAGCRIANSVLHDAFEWHGEIKVDLHLDAGDSQIHNGGNRTWSNFGLMLQPESLNRRPGIAQSETVTMRADVSELLNPTGLLAQMLVGVLRTITFANIDVDRFSKSLDELVANAAELQE